MKSAHSLTCLTAIIFIMAGNSANAEYPMVVDENIRIISPADGTVVKPGSRLEVKVNREGSGATSVTLQGYTQSDNPTGPDPLIFHVDIAENEHPRRVPIIAVDSTERVGDKSIRISKPVSIIIAPPDLQSLGCETHKISLMYIGDGRELECTGHSVAGLPVDLTETDALSFTSMNEEIATVDYKGHIIGKNKGTAVIQAAVPALDGKILKSDTSVIVPESIRGDLNNDGIIDKQDLKILNYFLNKPPVSSHDARDLNHDGAINDLDAKQLSLLCSQANCTSNP